MNTLRLVAALTLFLTAAALGAPGDRIAAKDLKGKISLHVGTKGTIQFKQQGDVLAEPMLVSDPDGNLPGVGVACQMEPKLFLLILRNRLSKALRYRAVVRLKGRSEFVETSLIVPVMTGLSSYESWQDPIEELVLFDFQLTDEKLQ